MKTHFLIISLTTLLFTNCMQYADYRTYFEPIYTSRTELNDAIQLNAARPIANSGKIYVINDLLFVGEENEGFHIFDNSDPKSPKKLKFLSVLGATDLTIRNNILYINQFTDLVTLKYNRENQTISIEKRIENTFPELISPDGFENTDTPKNSIITNWKIKE